MIELLGTVITRRQACQFFGSFFLLFECFASNKAVDGSFFEDCLEHRMITSLDLLDIHELLKRQTKEVFLVGTSFSESFPSTKAIDGFRGLFETEDDYVTLSTGPHP